MKRKLPIGIQDFAKIREGDFIYVDKTARIHELISGSASAFFLSRPRRFGKSLLCSTLGAVFEGRRDLFDGTAGQTAASQTPPLAINALDWEWKKHPVIRLDLNAGDYIRDGVKALHSTISYSLIFTMLGLNCRSEVRIAAGRIDTLVETKNYVYCFEFKLNGTAEEALKQIDSKDYLLPWTRPAGPGGGKTLFKIGVKFDHKKHNIGAWDARKYGTKEPLC